MDGILSLVFSNYIMPSAADLGRAEHKLQRKATNGGVNPLFPRQYRHRVSENTMLPYYMVGRWLYKLDTWVMSNGAAFFSKSEYSVLRFRLQRNLRTASHGRGMYVDDYAKASKPTTGKIRTPP